MYRVRALGDVFSQEIILKCDGFREAIFGPKTSLQRFRPKNVKILICFTFAFAVHRHRWFQAHPDRDHIKKLLMQAVQSFASHLVWILDCAATALKIGSLSGLRSSLLRSDRQIRAGTDPCRRYVCFSPGSEESATPSHSKHWSSLVHPFSSYDQYMNPSV